MAIYPHAYHDKTLFVQLQMCGGALGCLAFAGRLQGARARATIMLLIAMWLTASLPSAHATLTVLASHMGLKNVEYSAARNSYLSASDAVFTNGKRSPLRLRGAGPKKAKNTKKAQKASKCASSGPSMFSSMQAGNPALDMSAMKVSSFAFLIDAPPALR